MVNTHIIGKLSEDLAAAYLQEHGYKIIERNFRCKLGEIDLIARQGKDLVFIEVKSRSGYGYGFPQESVHKSKQLKLRRVAAYYLQKNGLTEKSCRFDVVSVTLAQEQADKIELIMNAF